MELEGYPKKRKLDGIYCRVEREGKYYDLCFTDQTEEEQQEFLDSMDTKRLQSMCKLLAGVLRGIGDQFGIEGRNDDCEE